MGLRLFADHCVPSSAIQFLREAGHEVLILRDDIPKDSDDSDVIAKAPQIQAILLSLNGDFSDIVTYPPTKYVGIISLQVRNRPEALPSIIRRLTDYFVANPEPQHYQGRLYLVEAHRIRIR